LLHGDVGVSRLKTMRSCRRNGRSCQNSNVVGTMRKPDHCGGRGTGAERIFAAVTAMAFSKAIRLSSGRDCLDAQAPI